MAQEEHRRPSPFGEGSEGLGYPTGGPPPGTPPRAVARTPPGPPGLATTAAVLGFVDAGLYGLIALWLLAGVVVTTGAGPGELALSLVQVLASIGLSAVLTVGGLQLLRGVSRRLLVRASIVQVIGLVLLLVQVLLTGSGATFADDVRTIAVGVGIAVVRIAFATRPDVTDWLAAGAVPEGGVPMRALLVPHAVLAMATLLAFWFVVPSDPYADATEHEIYGITDWSYLYAGGDPVSPPRTGDDVWDGDVSGDARDCHDGSMTACDELASAAQPGTPYEWLGATCGGRLAQRAFYPCVHELPAG